MNDKTNKKISPMQTSKMQEQKREEYYLEVVKNYVTRQKRDLPQRAIKESFSWLFQQNCHLISKYQLQNHIPEIASRIRQVDIGSEFHAEIQSQGSFREERRVVRLDQSSMYVILEGRVRLEKLSNQTQDYNTSTDVISVTDMAMPKSPSSPLKFIGPNGDGVHIPTPANGPRLSFDDRSEEKPKEETAIKSNIEGPGQQSNISLQKSNLSLSNTPKPMPRTKEMTPRTLILTASLFRTKLALYKSKTTNKNSSMRKDSSLIRHLKNQEYHVHKNYKLGNLTNKEKTDYPKDEALKLQLIETQFISEFTAHSSPELQAQILHESLVRRNNLTLKPGYYKDVILTKFEEIRAQEVKEIEKQMEEFDGHVYLEPGSIVNAASLIHKAGRLRDYQLVVEGSEIPVIGVLETEEFKQALLHVDDQHVDKLLVFSYQIPGFKEMSRTSSKKVFYQFTRIKLHKGWQIVSNSLQKALGTKQNSVDDSRQHRIYIILKGNFIFQSFKNNEQSQVRTQFEKARNLDEGKTAIKKFLKVKGHENPLTHSQDREHCQHISKEDRKLVSKQFQAGKHHLRYGQQKVKKLMLCQGQVFGEDECLKAIFRIDNYPTGLIQSQSYTVTCQSNDAQVLVATIDDVLKHFKNEAKIVHFLKQEYINKFPSQFPVQEYFKDVFSGNKGASEIRFDFNCSEASEDSENAEKLGNDANHPTQTSEPKELPQKTKKYAIDLNFMRYGFTDSGVNNLLLDRNETDFRTTMQEIVEEYPFTKPQRNQNIESRINLSRLEANAKSELDSYKLKPLQEDLYSQSRSITRADEGKDLLAMTSYLHSDAASNVKRYNSENKLFNQTGFQSTSQHSTQFLNVHQVNRAYMNSKLDSVLNKTFFHQSDRTRNPRIPQVNRTHSNVQSLRQVPAQGTSKLPNIDLPGLKNLQFFHSQSTHQLQPQPTAPIDRSKSRLAHLKEAMAPTHKKMGVAQTMIKGRNMRYQKLFERPYHELQEEARKMRERKKEEQDQMERMKREILERLREEGRKVFLKKKQVVEERMEGERKRKEFMRNRLMEAFKQGFQRKVEANYQEKKRQAQIKVFQEHLMQKVKTQHKIQLQDKLIQDLGSKLQGSFKAFNQKVEDDLDNVKVADLPPEALYLEQDAAEQLQDQIQSMNTVITNLQEKFAQYRMKLQEEVYNPDEDLSLQINEQSLQQKKWSFIAGESDQLNPKTQCYHISIDFDDNACMILNYYMLLTKQLIKEKNLKLKDLQQQRIQQSIQLESEQFKRMYEEIVRYYDEKIQEQRIVSQQLGIQDKVDVIKEILIRKGADGELVFCTYHDCLGQQEQQRRFRMDADGKENPLLYDFQYWGWLGNQYLANNHFQLPSWSQIKRGIVNEQIELVKQEENAKMSADLKQKMGNDLLKRAGRRGNINEAVREQILKTLQQIAVKAQLWNARFKIVPFPEDEDSPIRESEFMDPYSCTNRSIFYLYSLRSFIHSRLNLYCRDRDYLKGRYLAPFAAALSKALAVAGKYRNIQYDRSITKTFIVYRGVTLDSKQLDLLKGMLGDHVNLRGYNSTSLSEQVAIDFAMKSQDPNRHPVLYKINLPDGTMGGHCFLMNEKAFTAYPEENELLLDDGLPFEIYNIYERQVNERMLTVIECQSKMPQRLSTGRKGTLQTSFDMLDFYKNDFRTPEHQSWPHYLCSFQSERKDMVFGGKPQEIGSNKVTELSDLSLGNLVAVSTKVDDADPLVLESVTVYPDEYAELGLKDEFLSQASFRVFNERSLYKPMIKDYLTQEKISTVRRYLSAQPKFLDSNELLSQKTDLQLVTFFPDQRKESIWQFEQIKFDSPIAHYVIMLKKWIWLRRDGFHRVEDLKEYEENSYLAVRRSGVEQAGHVLELEKSDQASYVYLTNERAMAAVWTWKDLNQSQPSKMLEVPLSLIQQTLTHNNWIYLVKEEQVDDILELKDYLIASFNQIDNSFRVISWNDELALFDPASKDGQQNKFRKMRTLQKYESIANWSICSFDGKQVKIDIFMVSQKDQEKSEKVHLTYLLGVPHVMVVTESTSKIFKNGDSLVSLRRPDVYQQVCIERSCILQDLELREQIQNLLKAKGICIKEYLLCQDNSKVEKRRLDKDPDFFTKQFHSRCDGRQTLIILKGHDDQILGGYTDIPWTNSGSVGKSTVDRNSFIFIQKGADKYDESDPFFIYKSNRTNEVYHTRNYGPHFIDLKLKGPNGGSQIMIDGCYQIPRNEVPFEGEAELGTLHFRYAVQEVFETAQISDVDF